MRFSPGFDEGTVFINGWRLRYAEGDHQVFALSSAIVDIEKQDGKLRWKAGGVLSDRSGDDPYDWCYHYTVLFWKSDRLELGWVSISRRSSMIRTKEPI